MALFTTGPHWRIARNFQSPMALASLPSTVSPWPAHGGQTEPK
jgi:hypothetical protein